MKKHKSIKNICMIAYTMYTTDARVRREAETLAAHGYSVTLLTLREDTTWTKKTINGVHIHVLKAEKYLGRCLATYILAYIVFMLQAFVQCTIMTLRGKIDAVHVHNMPDFLVFAALIPRLFGKKLVLDIHDSMLETYQGKFGRLNPLLTALLILEERASAAFCHSIICVNPSVA